MFKQKSDTFQFYQDKKCTKILQKKKFKHFYIYKEKIYFNQ